MGILYDKAEWHYTGNYPDEIPISNGAIHMGVFLRWSLEKDLIDREYFNDNECKRTRDQVEKGTFSGTEFVFEFCSEKLTNEMFTANGNRFAESYYGEHGTYLVDYQTEFGTKYDKSIVDETALLDKLRPVIDAKYNEFQDQPPRRSWFKWW